MHAWEIGSGTAALVSQLIYRSSTGTTVLCRSDRKKKASSFRLPGSATQGGNQSQIKADVCYVRRTGAVSWLMGLHLSLVINFCPWREVESGGGTHL